MIKSIILVTLVSGHRIVGTLVNMQRGLIVLDYPFYVSVEDKVVVPPDVQLKALNIPIESMVTFDPADGELKAEYEFFVTAMLAGNMLKNVYPGIKMSTVDPTGQYKFFNCINQQSPNLN